MAPRVTEHQLLDESDQMSKVFFTSDIHIGHRKIAMLRAEAFGQNLSFDPNVDDAQAIMWHDAWLAHQWDSVVGKDDVVWVLGDISSGTNSAQYAALEWIKQRPGEKHLIIGNHDGCHPMYRDSHKWQEIYLGVGEPLAKDRPFRSAQTYARRRLALPEGHCNALMCHFPYRGDHTSTERFTQYRIPDLGKDYIIHGHTHRPEKFDRMQIHVGVDAWAGQLIPLETLARYAMHLDWENNGRK